jgi:exodeoxyribonuclease V beta subunit
MLSLNAFESGMLFEQQLIEDESRLRYQACADFWRRHCYPLPRDIAAVIHEAWKGPRDLLKSLDRWLQGEAPQLKSPPPAEETLAERHQQIIARINALKQQWREQVGEIEAVLENSGLDRRKFNRGNQGKWIEKVNAWAQEETLGYQLPDALEKFSQAFLHERTKAGGEPPVHPLFSAVEALLASPLTLTDLVIARAMVEIREAVARKSAAAASWVLTICSAAWMTRCAARAAKRWPAPFASVSGGDDRRISGYRPAAVPNFPPYLAAAAGDGAAADRRPQAGHLRLPRRGYFTYMKARGDVAAHYTLDTNWRSAPGMVESVNRLFSLSDNPFMFREIPFCR